MKNEKKKCPYCAEEINFEAIKCKHCGERLPNKIQVVHRFKKLEHQNFTLTYYLPQVIFAIYFVLIAATIKTKEGEALANTFSIIMIGLASFFEAWLYILIFKYLNNFKNGGYFNLMARNLFIALSLGTIAIGIINVLPHFYPGILGTDDNIQIFTFVIANGFVVPISLFIGYALTKISNDFVNDGKGFKKLGYTMIIISLLSFAAIFLPEEEKSEYDKYAVAIDYAIATIPIYFIYKIFVKADDYNDKCNEEVVE